MADDGTNTESYVDRERVDALESHLQELSNQIDELRAGAGAGPADTSTEQTVTRVGPALRSDLSRSAPGGTIQLELPRFDAQQIEQARSVFRLAGHVEQLPPEFHQELALWHVIFAASTECAVWTAEWDRIIDEAKGLVDQGVEDIVDFINREMAKAGFPPWAVFAVNVAIEIILSLGEAELDSGLELARYSGKVSLWLRCKTGF
jgi:hypothetical protein